MGAYTKDTYINVWNSMEDGQWYTAAELGMAAASMTAMVRRGLVQDKNCRPKKYMKIANPLVKILDILKDKEFEYFTLYKAGRDLGMLCSLKNERVLDCWEKPYDISGAYKLIVNHQEFTI
jgi:hypothetical protein